MKTFITRMLSLCLAAMMLASCGLAETIKYRDSGNQVLNLQVALAELNYYTGELDGNFGSGTLKAVKAFQKDAGLTVDGKAGKLTQATLTALTGIVFEGNDMELPEVPVLPEQPETPDTPEIKGLFAGDYRTMQFGTAGERVRILQRALLALGFDVKVDGDYGSKTHKAVKAFQIVVGLTADGKAGKQTLQTLETYFDEAGDCISGPIAGNPPAEPDVDDEPIYDIPKRTLRYGDTGLDVEYTLFHLYNLGYYNKTVDGKFGSGMLAAVKAFQKKHGLTADGVVGPATIKVLFSSDALKADETATKPGQDKLTLPLKKGDVGEQVKTVQVRLDALGYQVGKLDGIFGQATLTAVRLFQARNGLTVDGKVGQQTLNKLMSDDAIPAET